jgi:hypothetical protein
MTLQCRSTAVLRRDPGGEHGRVKTVYADEVEGRWVTLKVYESEDAEDEDADPVVRVTVAPLEDGAKRSGADARYKGRCG